MAKYRLLTPHVLHGGVREAGTEVGDGTDFPYDADPTPHMEGLDAVGKRKVAGVLKRHFPDDDTEGLPGFHRIEPTVAEPEPEPAPPPSRRSAKDEDC